MKHLEARTFTFSCLAYFTCIVILFAVIHPAWILGMQVIWYMEIQVMCTWT